MQKIISWNVASVRARLPLLLEFLKQEAPDIVFLQEIKATEETFPAFDFQLLGYHSLIVGQKSYNGVAILSKENLINPVFSLAGFEDQARFIQAETKEGMTLVCVYVPNGNPPEKNPKNTAKLLYKLRWMDALNQHVSKLVSDGKKVVVGGDFNVIERETDVYNPDAFRTSALMVPQVLEKYAAFAHIGLINVIRQFYPEPHSYSFWDFMGGAWAKNHGILLDALWVSGNIHKNIQQGCIYREIRGCPGTSDHAPVGMIMK